MKLLSIADIKNISGGNSPQSTIVIQGKYADCNAMEDIALSGSIVFFSGMGALVGIPLGSAMTHTAVGGLVGAGAGAAGGLAVGMYAGLAASLLTGLYCRASILNNSAS